MKGHLAISGGEGGGAGEWGDITGTLADQTNLDAALGLKAPLASPTFTGTVGGVTKAMVGLGSADNTSDAAKPVSTATQTELDLKAPLADPVFTGLVDVNGTARIYDQTAVTGVTTQTLKGGAGQVATSVLSVQDNAGVTERFKVPQFGRITIDQNSSLADEDEAGAKTLLNIKKDTLHRFTYYNDGLVEYRGRAELDMQGSANSLGASGLGSKIKFTGTNIELNPHTDAPGCVGINVPTASFPTGGTRGLVFSDGTAMSGMASNTAGLYAEDVSGTVNLFVINEAGVVTQLSGVTHGEPTEETTTSTGTVNDFDLDAAFTLLRCNNATDLTLTGFTVAGAAPTGGDRVIIVSVGAGNVFLTHQAGSTAANRLINAVTSGATPLAAGTGVASYVYDDTTDRWRLTSHDQGAAIAITFAAGDYVGDGTITWTVESADVLDPCYTIVGKKMIISAAIGSSTTGGTASTELRFTIPGGYTTSKFAVQPARITEVGTGVRVWGLSYTLSGGTYIRFQKVNVVNFALETNGMNIQYTNTIELT